ncbi:protein amnionless [Ixodes scapularis]|uniref:protein amnionless n=1 Tax=Ixodes scapularis TaxID=6945 RepID=UPI001C38EFAE|nr:protein amnionless [Ixodes scapularis]
MASQGGCHSAVKKWIPDTRFESGQNWASGQKPCSGQSASLAEATGLAVHLGSSISLGGMVFQKSGALVLDEGASISFTRGPSSCPGEAKFVGQERVHWYNSDNWALRESEQLLPEPIESRPTGSPRPLVVPDAEMVPCPSDHVEFEDTRFRVDTDALTPRLRTMQIGDVLYDGTALAAFLETDAGKELFAGDVTGGTPDCTDPAGCACGNDRPEPLERICLQHAPKCPHELPCNDPVTPLGNCCPICVSMLVMRPSSGFRFSTLLRFFEEKVLKAQFSGIIQAYLHRTWDGRLQAVLSDLSPSDTSRPATPGKAHKLATELAALLNGATGLEYAVSNTNLSGSQSWKNPATGGGIGSTSGSSAGGIVGGIVLALLILALIIFLWWKRPRLPLTLYRGRQLERLLPLARFDEGRVELELGTTPHDDLVPMGTDGFENPLIGGGPFKSFPEFGPESKNSSTFENPMFETETPPAQD